MSIQIFDKAAIIKKDGVKHFMVKYGSKNSFTCHKQQRIDNHFRSQYLRRQARDSDWRVIAQGDGKMANTIWNAPTSYIYGCIMFGNKRNIALYLDKVKPVCYEELDKEQNANFDKILNWYTDKNHVIDLANIKDEQKYKEVYEYCGNQTRLIDHNIKHDKCIYWNLDNL
jgi:hypothetical protein